MFDQEEFARHLATADDQLDDAAALAERGSYNSLERDYKPTRYPDALVEGTPRDAYTESDYERSRRACSAARRRIEDGWSALLAAADDEHEPQSADVEQKPADHEAGDT